MMLNLHKIGWITGLTLILSMPAMGKVYWGARTGIARSSLVQKIDLDYWSGARLGYSAAVLADIPFYERFSFRPEIAFVYEGGSFRSELEEEGVFLHKHRVRNHSLQPSLNVAFNIPISGVKMAVYGGPAFDVLLWEKLTTESIRKESATIEKKIRPFDIGVNAGISVEYNGVFFSITTLSGILRRQTKKTEGESSAYQNNLTFSLGYIFR
jgi:hypothetical protein